MARGRVETTSAILENAPFSTVMNPPTERKKFLMLLDRDMPFYGTLTVTEGGDGVSKGDILLYVYSRRPVLYSEDKAARYKFDVFDIGPFQVARRIKRQDLPPDL